MPATAEAVKVISIRQVRVGNRGRLVVAQAANSTIQRLMAMGLTPGLEVKVIRVAPLGDPIVLEAKGFQVSLRKHEADGLALELKSDSIEG